jgi:hypothetical protein
MRYACHTGYHERCPGRWCTCPCHPPQAAAEWPPEAGTFDAPPGPEEAEALELGGRVPSSAPTSPCCSTTPPDYA